MEPWNTVRLSKYCFLHFIAGGDVGILIERSK